MVGWLGSERSKGILWDTLGKSSGKSEWTTIGGGLSTAHRRSSLGNSGGWTLPTLPTRKKTMHIVRWSMFGQWTTLDLPDYPSICLSHPKLCTYGDLLSFVPGLLTDIYHMFAARAEPARCGARPVRSARKPWGIHIYLTLIWYGSSTIESC